MRDLEYENVKSDKIAKNFRNLYKADERQYRKQSRRGPAVWSK